jgi:hypothetical protein
MSSLSQILSTPKMVPLKELLNISLSQTKSDGEWANHLSEILSMEGGELLEITPSLPHFIDPQHNIHNYIPNYIHP